MKNILLALQFLTILPVNIKSKVKEKDLSDSIAYFPLIGAFIGLILYVVVMIFSYGPDSVLAAVLIISHIFITGALHLDGFSDTCDGLFSGQPKDRILEIMRDSRVGAMGVAGVVSLLILKYSLFVSISHEMLGKSLILTFAFSRWAQVLACYLSKYARAEGKGKSFIGNVDQKYVIRGAVFTLVLFLFLAGLKGLMVFFISIIPVIVFINYIKSKLNGMTGDTVGATNEIAEVFVLFCSLIIF